MFSITVRDHVMVAHSLIGAMFGPAQRLHGATFVVAATFQRADLGPDGVVVDLGLAAAVLREVLAPLDYRNLDEVPELVGLNTTTEVLARFLADRLADRIRAGALGPDGLEVSTIAVELQETPTASARFERAL